MNLNESFLDEEETKPPKVKADGVNFPRSLESRRYGYKGRDKHVDKYNVQAVAEDSLIRKEFSDMVSVAQLVFLLRYVRLIFLLKPTYE